MTRWTLGALVAVVAGTACASSSTTAGGVGAAASGTSAWTDSVLATMSLRDKVAQMVWPFMLGDYAPTDAPAWRQLERLVTEEHVGGFIIIKAPDLDAALEWARKMAQALMLPDHTESLPIEVRPFAH